MSINKTLLFFVSVCGFMFIVCPLGLFGASNRNNVVVCDDVKDPATLDPQKQFTEKNRTILQQIFEELIRFDENGKYEPLLAERWERIDPLTMRFFLRKGILFHNKEPFTSESVRYSLSRYLDPSTNFPGRPFISSISSSTVVDDYTIDIHTFFPDGLLLNRIASIILIVPPNYIKTNGESALEENPVGTGPFQFVQWKKGEQIVLEANPDYWRNGYPKVKELVFRFLPQEEQMEALLRGDVDLVTEMPGTYTLRAMENSKTTVVKKDTFYTVVGHFNTSKGPLADRRVRLAVNLAVNRNEIIRYDILGNGVSLASITMPGEVGFNPHLTPYPFDVERAKKLMAEAGFKNGFKLRAISRAQGERTARIIAKQLERIGISCEIKTVTTDADVFSELNKGGWDLGFAALPDPMAHSFFIQSLILYSKSPFSLHHNPEYDKRLESMVSELDVKKQDLLGQELDSYIHQEVLCIPTYQRIRTYGVTKRIKFIPYITGIHYFDRTDLR